MLTRLRLAWRLYRDPRVAPRLKVFLPIIAVLYVLSPIDLVPDMLLGPGQLDDLTVVAIVAVLIGRLARWAPAGVVEEHLARMGRRGSRSRGRSPRNGDVIDVPYQVVGQAERDHAAR